MTDKIETNKANNTETTKCCMFYFKSAGALKALKFIKDHLTEALQ